MTLNVGTLQGVLELDSKQFDRGLDGSMSGAQKKAGGMFSGISGLAKGAGAAIGGAFAVGALVDFGGQLIETAMQVDVYRKKAATVFEDQVGSVQKWADANNEAMGLTDDQLIGLAAGFGDLLKPMGFTAEQAATMSTKTLELSGALSAWSGGQKSAAEVSEILQAAMLGERDSLKSLGISITEADVQQRLMEKGQQDLTGAALQQAEAIATQELITEKSTDAQKAWTDGSMDATKKQNELKAKMAEVTETLGTKLLPIAAAFTDWLVTKGIPFVEDMVETLGPWVEGALKVATAVGTDVVKALQTMAQIGITAVAALVDTFLAGVEWIVKAAAKAFGWVPGVGDDLRNAAKTVETFRDDTNAFLDGIKAKTIEVGASTGGAEGQLQKVQNMLGQITNKTVTVTVIESLVRQEAAQASNRRGLQARAAGGPVSSFTPYLVGERGPEVFVPSAGGRIVPNHALGAGVAGGYGSATIVVELDGRTLAKAVKAPLAKQIRVKTGTKVA